MNILDFHIHRCMTFKRVLYFIFDLLKCLCTKTSNVIYLLLKSPRLDLKHNFCLL